MTEHPSQTNDSLTSKGSVGRDPANGKFSFVKHFIREGEADAYLGRFVVDLIASEESDNIRFAVFLDEDLGIQWYVREPSGHCLTHRYFSDNFPLVLNDVVHLETLSASLIRKPVEADTRVWVRQQIAKALKTPGEDQTDADRASVATDPETDGQRLKDYYEREADHLGRLRRANPVLRATRRLTAEAIARAYVPQSDNLRICQKTAENASLEVERAESSLRDDTAALERTGNNEAAAALDETKRRVALARELEENARAAVSKAETEQAASSVAAGQAAVKCVELARDYLKARSSDRGRQKMICGAVVALCVMLGLFLYGYQCSASSPLDRNSKQAGELSANRVGVPKGNEDLVNVMTASTMGALGAMLSLLMGAAKRDYDSGAGVAIHYLEGATRIMAGVLGACFIILGLKSEFLMGFLEKDIPDSGKQLYLQLLLGFAAGLSERLVPNFVSNVEAQVQTK